MPVLVTTASKHGATLEIAEAIARGLSSRGVAADALPAEQVESLDGYDAIVLGSAVYAGHWLRPASQLAERHFSDGAAYPVWLFSSGPVGSPDPKPEGDPVDLQSLIELTGARAHRVFAGRIDHDRLSFAERALVRALRAPIGDFRDWDAVDAFAAEIASELTAAAADDHEGR